MFRSVDRIGTRAEWRDKYPPPNADLYTDSDLIHAYVVSSLVRAGRTVVAIIHSYGGQIGTDALIGLGRRGQG